MTPMQQILLGVGAKKKTYMEDVFSTYLYKGNGTSGRTITNNINVSGEDGMVWVKNRTGGSSGYEAVIADTLRGNSRRLYPSETTANAIDTTGITGFTTSGFTVGDSTRVNYNNHDFASWTFRKAKGFFDFVTYTGNGTAGRTVSHSLGCMPGMIWVKRLDAADSWFVYHRELGATKRIYLNNNGVPATNSGAWNDTEPTSSVFTVGSDGGVNDNGASYVAYLFAGGESTAATARSVDLDASGDYLDVVGSSDFSFGSGDFTVEGWFKVNSTSAAQTIIGVWDHTNNQRSWLVEANNSGGLLFSVSNNGSSTTDVVGNNCVSTGVWTHFAAVRDGDNLKLFVNGTQVATSSYSMNLYANSSDKCFIGLLNGASNKLTGKLSNIRVVKGTAVYTSSFKPPTEPLTNITNTKLLCCNNASVTGSTVTPGTIDATGDPTASTDSPFDDPAAFTFGENGDQGIIKCGSYVGAGSTDIDVNLGWEPEWVLIRNTSESSNWLMLDSMRGIVTNHNEDARLYADKVDEEVTNADHIDLTPTGFKVKQSTDSGQVVVYTAIRRADGYVGKPADAGTDVFAMATGTSGSDVPEFVTGFPVDASLFRIYASTANWLSSARLTQAYTLQPHDTDAEVNDTNAFFDYSNGWGAWTGDLSSYLSWNWKRHAGFDVVTYTGNGTAGHQIPHSLSKTPEMMWMKKRDNTGSWSVYHKGLNGGTNPETRTMYLDDPDAEYTQVTFNNTAPTSTHFTVGSAAYINGNHPDGNEFIALLFASVEGISKCGFYDGSDSELTITTGFQPRFVIIKRTSGSDPWFVLDTTRGWGSGNDQYLQLQVTDAQAGYDFGAPTSTGFTLVGNVASFNDNGQKYIYYAHA